MKKGAARNPHNLPSARAGRGLMRGDEKMNNENEIEKHIKDNAWSVTIYLDEFCENPNQSGDNDLFLLSYHRDFWVEMDKVVTKAELLEAFEEPKKSDVASRFHIFPIEAYIHSGVVLAFSKCGNFPDLQWDVSLVGAILADKKEFRNRKTAERAAISLLDMWNQYLSGDVYGYVVKDPNGKEVDSCCGFYGLDYAREEGMKALKFSQEQASETVEISS